MLFILEKVYVYNEKKGIWQSLKLISEDKRNKIIDSIGEIIEETIDSEIKKLKSEE